MGVLGERDRIRLMEKGALPMEVFPPLSKVTRNLIELAETSEDESLKLELRDQARKRMQGFLTGLSDVAELKDMKTRFIGSKELERRIKLFICEAHLWT